MKYPNKIWVIFDLSNGDELSRRYIWYFETREKAINHIKWQKEQKYSAKLSRPIKYIK